MLLQRITHNRKYIQFYNKTTVVHHLFRDNISEFVGYELLRRGYHWGLYILYIGHDNKCYAYYAFNIDNQLNNIGSTIVEVNDFKFNLI